MSTTPSASAPVATAPAQTNKLSVRSEAWDACAEKYDQEGTVVVGPHASYMLDRSIGFLKARSPLNASSNDDSAPKFSIADIACGTGALSLEAVSRVEISSVLASDYSEGMCKITQRKYTAKREKDPKTSELKTLVADATALSSIADNTYDAAFCSFGVMLTPNPTATVNELVRITKPNGIIGITTWSRADRSQFHAFQMAIQTHIKNTTPQEPTPPAPAAAAAAAGSAALPATAPSVSFMPFSSFEEFRDVFAANNVEVELLEYHDGVTRVYEGAEGFWSAMRGATPIGVKAASQDEATGKKVIEYVSQTFGAFSPFNLRSTSIVAIGRKSTTPQA